MKEYIEKSEAVERALYTPIMSNGPVEEKDIDAWTDGVADAQDQIAKLIGKIPAADVVERKRGEWIEHLEFWRKCSECGAAWHEQWVIGKHLHFCPNCGADMRSHQNILCDQTEEVEHA